MIKLISFFTMLFTSIIFAQQADDIIGKYHLPNGLDIAVFKEGKTYSGKIVALNNYPETKDVKNSNKAKRNDLLLEKVIITKLVFDADKKKWTNGKMYGPDKGITVNLEVTDFSENEITVVGSKFIFWKTIKWKKLN